jgi:CotH kinase protein/Fn3 associated/Lamin Tail Domain/Secretion system C-terminal sorting domain
MKKIVLYILLVTICKITQAQIVINEGSNKNYSTIADEEDDYNDWIEIYNYSTTAVDLFNYSLTDTTSKPTQWRFPHYNLPAGGYKVVYCSGKDYFASLPFNQVQIANNFSAVVGWNNHNLSTPYYWDGVSNLLINVCSYRSAGYTKNSVFYQTSTPFNSTTYGYKDNNDGACSLAKGTTVSQRPNLKINGQIIGTGTIQNGPNDYPAPYGNWYWSAKNQMLVLASELTAAGLTAGNINSLAFQVAVVDSTTYDYVDIKMNKTNQSYLTSKFYPVDGNNFHTNFKIDNNGETISLYSPSNALQNSLLVQSIGIDASNGLLPNASANATSLYAASPNASNTVGSAVAGVALPPTFSVASGIKSASFNVSITNPNGAGSSVYYTLDGEDPGTNSILYNGTAINVFQNTVLKATAFVSGKMPSTTTNASYLFGLSHTTPILSLITDPDNLFGPNGNFDNPFNDWLKAAYVECFDSTAAHTLLFAQHTGMIQDGGAGGSRSQPQRSFKLDMSHSVVGDGVLNYGIIPDRPKRTKYSKLYLRNGSNQFLKYPIKDAAQVRMMAGETNCTYSAWRPMTVYINGEYWGLYELREKLDAEYYKLLDTASTSSIDIISQSYYYDNEIRSVAGNPVDTFAANYNAFNALNPNSVNYWDSADQYFDLIYYADYIIGQSWMGNVDWPQNNIKMYRSNKTKNRYRFTIIDQELSMAPNGWTNCTDNHIDYLNSRSTDNPFINVWLQSMDNTKFHDYFINRFADLMNTSYDTSRLLAINKYMYDQTYPEMANEYSRWGTSNISGQMADFTANFNTFNAELKCRTAQVRNHIVNGFNLVKQVNTTLNVNPANAGTIKISTVSPATYPWKGVYFDGVPVSIEAIAKPGFVFVDWDANAVITDTLNPIFNNMLTSNLTFQANFKATNVSIDATAFEENNYKIYPTIADAEIIISTENKTNLANADYQIINTTGKIVANGQLKKNGAETKINISKLAAGMYIISVINKQKNSNERVKFIKK